MRLISAADNAHLSADIAANWQLAGDCRAAPPLGYDPCTRAADVRYVVLMRPLQAATVRYVVRITYARYVTWTRPLHGRYEDWTIAPGHCTLRWCDRGIWPLYVTWMGPEHLYITLIWLQYLTNVRYVDTVIAPDHCTLIGDEHSTGPLGGAWKKNYVQLLYVPTYNKLYRSVRFSTNTVLRCII